MTYLAEGGRRKADTGVLTGPTVKGHDNSLSRVRMGANLGGFLGSRPGKIVPNFVLGGNLPGGNFRCLTRARCYISRRVIRLYHPRLFKAGKPPSVGARCWIIRIFFPQDNKNSDYPHWFH